MNSRHFLAKDRSQRLLEIFAGTSSIWKGWLSWMGLAKWLSPPRPAIQVWTPKGTNKKTTIQNELVPDSGERLAPYQPTMERHHPSRYQSFSITCSILANLRRLCMNQSSKILLSMRFMLLGYRLELRPNRHALGTASLVMTIDLSLNGCSHIGWRALTTSNAWRDTDRAPFSPPLANAQKEA